MAITQNDLEILKSEIMADTADGGGLPTGIAVVDGVSNNLFPDVSDIDRLLGRVRLRKVSLAVKTANAELLQATRMLFTELPDNENISVFAFKATSFADRRSDAQNKIESYLAFGTKWAGHLLETQLAGQRVIQISLDAKDPVPAVGQPLVLVQNEGQSDEFYQYLRPLKVDTVERRFQKSASETVTRTVATIEFGDTLNESFNGLTVQEFYLNASTTRRAILREARIADAAKYYSASRLAEPVVAMQSRQVRLNSIYTQVVPSTQVETPILQRDPANQVATQARGDGVININQSVNVAANTAFNLPSGIAVGTLSMSVGGFSLTDRDGELVNAQGTAYASIKYGIGQITWYNLLNLGQMTVIGSYKPASEFTRVAQTDYQVVDDNAGYNYVRELGAEPLPNSLKITYTVGGNNYLVHDDGRGNLIDDEGNGRGTVQGKTVLLTTAAIPDAASYIIYSFGVDLDTVKYGSQVLPAAYHSVELTDVVSGNITITWGTGKTATMINGVITGDATGDFDGRELRIAPKQTVEKNTQFSLSYQKVIAGNIMSNGRQDAGGVGLLDGIVEVTYLLPESFESFESEVFLKIDNSALDQGKVSLSVKKGSNVVNAQYLVPDKNSPPSTRYETSGSSSGSYVETGYSRYIPSSPLPDDSHWRLEVLSSDVDRVAKSVSFKARIYRMTDGISVIARAGVSPIFRNIKKEVPLYITGAQTAFTAVKQEVLEPATKLFSASSLSIVLPQDDAAPVARGSVFVDFFNNSAVDKNGRLMVGAAEVGAIDYNSGVIELTAWQAGQQNTATLKSMLRENDPVPLANLIFRTPVAPLKEASLQISADLANGTPISLSTDEQGNITGHNFAHGTVDFKAGVVALYFYERLGVTANPSIVNESWYDAANIYMEGSTNYINKPIYVKPDSIRYNAIAYSYLPLDKELIGLDPVRLPTDGRVPFVRKGDSIAITELKTMQLSTNAPNDLFDLGFERLSDVNVVDANGLKVNSDYLNVDLDAGTLQLNGLFDMSFYTAPLTAKYRIMDIALVIETDISGRVTLSTPITHDYSTAAVFSSMLLAGDMQARAYNVFGQKSWGSVWNDSLIGDATTSQLQVTNNPIVVTNRDAIEERWALVFTSATAFNIIGQTVGQIGTGTTSTLTAPINPMTGYPYFTIPSEAWGTGWSANNVVRINTAAAKYPIWIGNAIQQHQGGSADNYDFTIGYHANIDRERAV